jgi:hypothetical protein
VLVRVLVVDLALVEVVLDLLPCIDYQVQVECKLVAILTVDIIVHRVITISILLLL